MSQSKFLKYLLLLLMAASVATCGEQVLQDTRPVPSEFYGKSERSQASVFDQEPARSAQDNLKSGDGKGASANQNTQGPSQVAAPAPAAVQGSATGSVSTDTGQSPEDLVPDLTPTPTPTPAGPPWGPVEFWEVTERSCLVGCHTHGFNFRRYDYIVANRDLLINAIMGVNGSKKMPPPGVLPGFSGSADETLLLDFLRSL